MHSALGLLVRSDLRQRIFSRRGEGPGAGKDADLEGERQTGCGPGLLDRACWELEGGMEAGERCDLGLSALPQMILHV